MLCSKKLNFKLENIYTQTLGAAYLKINQFSFEKPSTINNQMKHEKTFVKKRHIRYMFYKESEKLLLYAS